MAWSCFIDGLMKFFKKILINDIHDRLASW